MAINFGAEYRRFNEEMEKKHQLYTQLGMTQEQIDALDAFDKEEFLSNNNYKRHVLSLDIDENTDAPEDQPLLYRKFGDVLSVVGCALGADLPCVGGPGGGAGSAL